VFPAVVVDLGNQVSPSEVGWVLEACNAAIVQGTCELDSGPGSAPPRAIAIVRLLGDQGRSVRLEVGLQEEERASWSVREIEFSTQDPPRERWRSVGLVLATLVGEVEAREAERKSSELPPAEPTPESAAARSEVEPARNASEAPSAAATPKASGEPAATQVARPTPEAPPRAPLPRPSVFVGAGILGGPSPAVDPFRWGGGVRGGWISSGGWVLSVSGDYSFVHLEGSEVEVGWFRAAAGTGYRVWLSERWSLGLGLQLGVRGLQIAPEADGSIRSSDWSPFGAADVEAWWQALAVGGAWASVEASSMGRQTRLLGRDREPDVVLPAVEFHGMLGLWWAL
jgi:hypothetical protein